MTRRHISSGSEFERTYSYSRAIVLGNHVLVSGTTGYNYATSTLAEGAHDQTVQLFRNVESALAQAGATLKDVIRVRMYIARPEDYETIMQVFARTFAGIDPTCTTVQAGLFDPAIRIEMDMDAAINAGT
ncbi:RidA family protein [Peristeroidobacter soli]|jgi:enamine deaminase RidA (YjgF/YER057c/UK114 family)|uniref:RidA family protein n=1 Tax=Peristeroidobacter soli TaxID=2497877 RepID=UPI00101BF104|nr:RidA family protein [Peristeroidobacter soli]